ncbi:MAG: amidohydrolase family protein [Promethearchaeota archaeon]
MTNRNIFSDYGLIGDNLDVKKNIHLEIDNNGKILTIKYEELDENEDINLSNQSSLLVPGFINSHVHIGDSFAKERGFNRDLISVVAPPNGLKHQLLAETSKDLKVKGIQKAALEMLTNGITCFADFRENGLEGIMILNEALKDSPIRYKIFGRFNQKNEIKSIFQLADGIGLASYKSVTSSIKEELRKSKDIFKKLIASHCAEVVRNENLIKEVINDNIIDIIVHGTQLKYNDLELIKQKGLALILCPRSNGYFGVGFPPIIDILKLNIPISLGTDNLMANSTDLFEELRYLYRITRVLGRNLDIIKISPQDLLKMVTINAARNLGLDMEMGSILEGKNADFFIIDLKEPNLWCKMDFDTLHTLIVQRTRPENIKKIFIKGELIFKRN